MYVTCTVRAKGTRLAKPVVSLTLVCLAFLTGLNRVAEYRNHWADVIAGFVIGGAIATFLVRLWEGRGGTGGTGGGRENQLEGHKRGRENQLEGDKRERENQLEGRKREREQVKETERKKRERRLKTERHKRVREKVKETWRQG